MVGGSNDSRRDRCCNDDQANDRCLQDDHSRTIAIEAVPRPGKDSRGFPVPIRPGYDPHPARQKPIGVFVSETLRCPKPDLIEVNSARSGKPRRVPAVPHAARATQRAFTHRQNDAIPRRRAQPPAGPRNALLTEPPHRSAVRGNATTGNTMSYSLSEAATACGVYKSTILRSIKAGRLTGTKDALGQWRIEPAELHRVYPPAGSNGAQNNGTRLHAMTALLEAQHRATLAEVQLAQLKTVLEDMRGDRDHWRTHAGATQRLLVDATARRPWWKRVAELVRPAASPRSGARPPHSPRYVAPRHA